MKSSRFDNHEGGIEIGKYPKPMLVNIGDVWSIPSPFYKIKESFSTSINELLEKGLKIILIYPIPEVGWHVPKRLHNLLSNSRNIQEMKKIITKQRISTSVEVFKARTKSSHELLDAVPDHENLIRVYPEEIFCDNERCYATSLPTNQKVLDNGIQA